MSGREGECAIHRLVCDVAIVATDRVLLVKYRDTSKYDGQRGWFLPDDFLQHLEDPADAAGRIVREQLGVALADARLDHVESFGNGCWHLVFHYRTNLDSVPELAPSNNLLAAEWFGLSSLPGQAEWAHHGWGLDVLGSMGVVSPGG